jgi:hypothetical protein
MPTDAPPLLPLPGLRDVYVLCAGLILGILLGPAVLGRAAPQGYAELFGAGEPFAALQDHHVETGALLTALQATGVSDSALVERRHARADEAETMQRVVASVMDRQAMLRLAAVGVALFVVMLLEALTTPTPSQEDDTVVLPPRIARLLTVRYALLAVGVALLLARPTLLHDLPWGFAAALLAVALLAGLVPLGKRTA